MDGKKYTINDGVWPEYHKRGSGLGANAKLVEDKPEGVPGVALRANEVFIPIDATPEQVREILGEASKPEDIIPAGDQRRLSSPSEEGGSEE